MIGDVLASTIICESLKFHFPNATVHFVANENTLAVLKGNPFIDKVIIFKNEYRTSKRAFFKFLKSIKKVNYHSTFDAYGKLESNLITLFAKADNKIGSYKWYSNWVYSETIHQTLNSEADIPLAVSNRLKLIDPLVKENSFSTFPKLYVSEQETIKAQQAISKIVGKTKDKLIMISILGSSSNKTYPSKYMAEVLDIICKNNTVKLLFNYIPNQKVDALSIFEKCSEHTQNCISFDFYAESLRDFIGLLSQCDLLIGNEGGAVNMAKALKIPSFCIFSPFIWKGAWHGQANKDHVSVHLRDYHPEFFEGMDKKQLKKNSQELYQNYPPQLFKQKLVAFLDRNNIS